MKYIRHFYIANTLLLILLLQSCGTSNNVVSNRLIQKRKFNKGWHINSSRKEKQKRNTAEVKIKDEKQKDVIASKEPSWTSTENNSVQPVGIQSESTEVTDLDTEIKNQSSDAVEISTIEESEAESEFTPIEENRELAPGPSSLDKAKYSYKKSWMYTIAAIVAITAGLLMFIGAWGWMDLVLGGILIGVAVVAYIFMFINLTKAAKHVGPIGSGGNIGLRFLIWGHIVIGSFVSILLFLIPLLVVSLNVKRSR